VREVRRRAGDGLGRETGRKRELGLKNELGCAGRKEGKREKVEWAGLETRKKERERFFSILQLIQTIQFKFEFKNSNSNSN
jgi:hypothetical protein